MVFRWGVSHKNVQISIKKSPILPPFSFEKPIEGRDTVYTWILCRFLYENVNVHSAGGTHEKVFKINSGNFHSQFWQLWYSERVLEQQQNSRNCRTAEDVQFWIWDPWLPRFVARIPFFTCTNSIENSQYTNCVNDHLWNKQGMHNLYVKRSQ